MLESKITMISVALLMAIALFGIMTVNTRIKKLLFLSLFQLPVLIFYTSLGYIKNAVPPVISEESASRIMANPIPAVLMLTAIVVGISVLSVGLVIAMKIEE